jgi:cyclic pyranopterin phosphate synthase
MKDTIRDEYGRSFKTLRVSLLSTCNLGCVYCTMSEDEGKAANFISKKNSLPVSSLLSLIRLLHEELSFTTVRLTGGEPLLYPHLVPVIEGIKAMGISQIRLTTNGFLLQKKAAALKAAGMQSINVSLDAVDEDVFFLMSKRYGVRRILDGIKTRSSRCSSTLLNGTLRSVSWK